MKKPFLYLIAFSIAFTGCGKKEDPAMEAAASEAPAEETVEKAMTETANSLMASGTEAVEKAVEVAAAKVAEVDFTNLSWDDVSTVSFEDKMKLASWATGQADSWKGKLTEAAAGQGLNMLSKMGDSGWQGALAKVVESINAVRESSPETYELARGALVSAWMTFEEQASSFLGK
ncbi:hypothetical protein G0Q06_00500 [Puniceicoccales bacterium CK1056]|uniref:Lipoprotein n=1 Tax=Oceanipulchritudo coccoides TaxID=2706888 RepID=A0A6B2LZJ8_9BACT|nr:hypothetical protein [Oceanipulchritudo coccoides]NDV60925.1 hypothetical protein [Oceanipulchritudo coccoides]